MAAVECARAALESIAEPPVRGLSRDRVRQSTLVSRIRKRRESRRGRHGRRRRRRGERHVLVGRRLPADHMRRSALSRGVVRARRRWVSPLHLAHASPDSRVRPCGSVLLCERRGLSERRSVPVAPHLSARGGMWRRSFGRQLLRRGPVSVRRRLHRRIWRRVHGHLSSSMRLRPLSNERRLHARAGRRLRDRVCERRWAGWCLPHPDRPLSLRERSLPYGCRLPGVPHQGLRAG
jgi:hypothetical protein